ncbi:nucleotidyltransferase family protein [Ornithinimicrobium sp. W1679]|uniref:nucleotidyltransferase family protein n=1 Tax=unclassified Ornithinimicrobium TaxID=2615080 RepID=UPI003CFB6C4F
MSRTTGLLLAAGEGRRYGMPKALVADEDGFWVHRAVRALVDGGCEDVVVVTGARAEEVEGLLAQLPEWTGGRVTAVRCGSWERGMGSSLRSGLTALASRGRTVPRRAVVHLVDLPDVGPAVVERLLREADTTGGQTSQVARAAYGGRPGHPVVLGQRHWDGVLGGAGGDAGARGYLRRVQPVLVECGDLATGQDVDVPG